jgi:hypothetical protein
MTKKVFVLGAGFSKAIEGAMPLMTELHTEVFRRLKDWEYFPKLEKINSRINGDKKDLEKLLSFLAEKQIWQGYAESNEHNTLYEGLKEKISEVIEKKERAFNILEADDWILKLFLNIIGQNIDIITFNYDQLVEKIIYHFPTPNSEVFNQISYDALESKRIIYSHNPSRAVTSYKFNNYFYPSGRILYSEVYKNNYNAEFNFECTTQPNFTQLNLNLCFKEIDFIRKAIIYNVLYRTIIEGKNFDEKEKYLRAILPNYKDDFKEKNYENLLELKFTEIADNIEKIADSFKDQLLGLNYNPEPRTRRFISPIVQEDFLKFPINHIGDRMGLKEARKTILKEERHQLYQFPADKIMAISDRERYAIPNILNFNLFKLHGSVNWYTKPNFGNYYYVPQGDNYLYKTELTDLQRLIVPPVANKSNLYEDSLFGAIWKGAYEKLKEADEVYFLGYSLPETDLQAKYLFQTGIKKDAKIFVVNKKGEENKYKNTFAGFANLNVEYCTADKNPIKTFTENHEGFYS